MIPQPITIGARTGTVVYLDAEWNVVEPDDATLARVLFDDGGSAFYRVQEKPRVLAQAVVFRLLGGPGSGNFGHAGRPGEVGGSGEGTSAERTAFVESAIRKGEAHKVSEDEFLKYHFTGAIPSDSYAKFEAGDFEFIHKKDFDTLLETREIRGEPVEIRVQAEPAQYAKKREGASDSERDRLYAEYEAAAKEYGTTPMMAGIDLGRDSDKYNALREFEQRWRDSGEDWIRDESGNLVYYSPQEMQEKGLPAFNYTVGAFVGDKAVGFSGDEFGASGVYVARAYQRQGLGVSLLKTYLEKSGRLAKGTRLGQMTHVGQELARALHRQLVKEAALRGAGYDESQPRDDQGQWTSGGGAGRVDRATRTRIERAKATHIPSTRNVQRNAAKSERAVADAVKGQDTDDQVPMDVIIKDGNRMIGVEVKTILQGKNDKITVHPESLARKESWLRMHGATGHTVAVDKRSGTASYYYRKGFGSFRLGSMQKVTLSMLHRLVRGPA